MLPKYFWRKRKQKAKKRVNDVTTLLKKKKKRKRKCYRDRNKYLSEDQKQKLIEYRRNYHLAHKK